MKWSNFASFFLVILTFNISPAEGLKWISEPLEVNKCKGHTVNLTWEYVEEPGEEVTQLQWIFNLTELIAYSSLTQGFNVEPKYQGRVNQRGQTGILLHNISAKDSGNYTLYPLVKWEERPNIQSVQLNVIEEAMEPDCSCKRFTVFPEERNGQAYRIMVGSCDFEINSSVCCPVVRLLYQYCVNDPSTICVPISNHNNQAVNLDQYNIIYVFLGIICVMLLILIIMGGIFFAVKRYHGMPCQCRNPRTTRNVEEGQLQGLQALQDTQQDDV